MAHIDKDTIQNLMALSRIECSEEQKEVLLNNLKKIIGYFEQLNEINTDDVPPCDHVLADMCNVMREDVPGPTLPREKFLSNAPAHIGGMIKVPTVIKQN
ncbi:Aspartyl/glutamyl-tRNA(Asn/Gln) amidotransferase subunit C [Neochlamydia sp. AcF65]|uniref:Asp-tRNA(Asn)/Glu-tRNA(Gln) amidotransferase subunit GatC n=1 Tax=Neochlamydia sp. AcF65 TaxID=2795735 RepID=UPI001BC9D45B|nr:Asp-tRNA(Asn)/Glu-tRNA(Gln) amidotransferase subunit GatC [Neochlamydia sp. AcF65]MBS4165620.1 Aspartyl/glutamyl-tRNA(Asn/Gln) amidotransferase subunit C [Neochlamydia sp. AcF65]